MDITDSFRPEDLPKTDFFDFVTTDAIGIGIGDRQGMSGDSLDPPLQGFDQVSNAVHSKGGFGNNYECFVHSFGVRKKM